MIFFKMLSSFFKILHSKDTPNQIAWGFALGALVGFLPVSSPQALLLFFIILLLNVNMGMAFLVIPIFKILSISLYALADSIGRYLLIDSDALKPLWTNLYNMPIVPFTKFNNTVVLGSFVIAIILFIPIVIFAKKGVIYYRTQIMTHIENYKIIKWLMATKVYALYRKIMDYRSSL
jgi:uncharacterized protein (TIGR03546 family)